MKFKRRFYRKFRYNRKRSFLFIFLFLLCLSFGLGYSLISTDLNIFGTTVLKDNRWSVYFDNIVELDGSVSPTVEPEITDDTTVSFSAKLKHPGDKYEFLIDVVNDGTIDAKIGNISMSPILTTEQQQFFEYEVTYESGVSLDLNQALDAGTTETLKVSFKYREQEDDSLYPSSDQTFNIVLTGEYVQGTGTLVNHPYLYNVLMNEAKSGGLARKYTGEHHDSFTEEPSKDIYHWYADNNTDGTAVQNKNNVIFADHCWQIIRTTDTGGVKMIYNGEVENNQCLNTRGNHVGYASATTQTLNSNYWYGTDYTYDNTNSVFSISGTTEQVIWNATTGPNLIGKYTCKKTSESGTCTTLYLVESYYNSSSANVIPLKSNSNYSQFGTLGLNSSDSSLSYVGYMYNTVYTSHSKAMTSSETTLSQSSIAVNHWYADSVTWGNPVANKYNLVNPYQISSATDFSELVGKYTFRNTTETYTNTSVYYITSVRGTTMYYIELNDFGNHTLSDFNYTYSYGNSFTDNGNGTYTINSPSTINRSDWYTNYINGTIKSGYYACKNAVNNTCSDLWYLTNISNLTFSYIPLSNVYKYAKGFTWDGSKYVLDNNTSVAFWNITDSANRISLNNAHYTCWDDVGECTSISYIYNYYATNNTLYYVDLTNGKSIDDAKNEMLYNNDVNQVSSVVKNGIEAWYKHYLLENYDDYVEDTIYCNTRSLKNANASGWNPNGGSINTDLEFDLTSDLICTNITDQFCLSNNNAHLTYKVGMLSRMEVNILNNYSILKTGQDYWIYSPRFERRSASGTYMPANGGYGNASMNSNKGVRLMISLKPKTMYLSGDGSMESPYVITNIAEDY